MKRTLLALLRNIIVSIVLLLSCNNTYASHILGAELTYANVSLDTYKITLVIYADCSPASAAAFATLPISSPQICIYDSTVYHSSINLTIQPPTMGIEITTLCPGDTSQCVSTTSTIHGVMKFVYSGKVVLPYTSSLWRFIYSSYMGSSGSAAGRAAAITNLNSPGSTYYQLTDTLNNSSAPNSNPVLPDSLRTNFCINQHNDFYLDAVDPDGDSLYVFLTGAMNGSGSTSCGSPGTPCTYFGTAWTGTPISATMPMEVLPDSFVINNHTGQLSFHPDAYQRPDIYFNIREYRAGVLVGTSQHEFNFTVQDCTGAFGCLSTAPSCSGTPLTGSISAATTTGCSTYTSLLSLTASTSGLSYQWQSSADSLSWGNVSGAISDTFTANVTVTYYYRCIITCIASSSTYTTAGIKLTIETLPNAGIITGLSHVCPDSTITLTDASPGGVWTCNNSHATVTGGMVTGVTPGSDIVKYTVTNSCGSDSTQFSITVNSSSSCGASGTGIQSSATLKNSFDIYPNPTKSTLTISGDDNITSVAVYNLVGQVIYTHVCNTIEVNVDVSALTTGIYFVKINGVVVRKFTKM